MGRPFRIGDRVRTLDRQQCGEIIGIQGYAGLSDKLIVALEAPSKGTVLLAIELWEKVKKEKL